ncbi:MAG: SPOR domain-containing protein [Nitrospirae bacterium]|nr:SPOR domain-containing protein [Magnetococcales bacterium]HAT49286.1 hypothetical protein [Alphaproteobacteria bacterium]
MNGRGITIGILGIIIWVLAASLHGVTPGFAEEAQVSGTRFNLLTEPINALVQIRERREPYVEPITIPEGRYHVSVTAPGYLGAHGTVDVQGPEWSGLVRLAPLNSQTTESTKQPCETLLQERNQLKKELAQLQERAKSSDKKPTSGEHSTKPPSPVPSDLVANLTLDKVDAGVEQVLDHLHKIPAEQRKEVSMIRALIDRLTSLAPNDPKVQRMKQLYEERFILYIGTFASDEKAKEIEARLASASIPTFRQQFQKDGKNLLRLCAGLFSQRQEAIDAVSILEREFNVRDAIIRKFNQ